MSSPDATITAAPNFQAFYIHPDGTTEALTCPRGTYTTSGTYAACCSESKCAMATACHDNKLSLDNFNVASCGRSATCQTMSIFSAPNAHGKITSSIFCAPVWLAYEVYRDTVPVTTVSAGTKSPSSASTGSAPSGDSASATATSAASEASQTGSGTTGSTSSSAGSSRAWIAGAVIGPIMLIALLGLGIWLFRRRSSRYDHQVYGGSSINRKKMDESPAGEVQEIGGYEHPVEYRGGDGEWRNGGQDFPVSVQKSEFGSGAVSYYAPVSQNQLHELPSESR